MNKKILHVFTIILSLIIISGAFIGCQKTGITGGEVENIDLTPKEIAVNKADSDDAIIYDIIDLDPEKPDDTDIFDDSTKYTYNQNYTVITGSADITEEGENKVYTLSSANTMLVNASGTSPFPYGTISCSVKSLNTCDSGIVFGYSSENEGSFEGRGVYYYFYFIGQGGYAYLGQVYDGNWKALKVLKLSSSVDESHFYDLKVVFRGKKIICYLDGDLKFAIRDQNVLKGTGYGIRSGLAGVVFKNLNVTNDYDY